MVFGMFTPGLMTGRQLELSLNNVNDLEYLQGNRFQLGLYGFSTHNASSQTDYSDAVFLETACRTLTKIGPNIYRWPEPLQHDLRHLKGKEKLKGEHRLHFLFRHLFKRSNIRAHVHSELQVHVHHHRILRSQSPESPMCNDIFQSLNACAQRLMTAHYEAEHFQEEIERLSEWCKSMLDFL